MLLNLVSRFGAEILLDLEQLRQQSDTTLDIADLIPRIYKTSGYFTRFGIYKNTTDIHH